MAGKKVEKHVLLLGKFASMKEANDFYHKASADGFDLTIVKEGSYFVKTLPMSVKQADEVFEEMTDKGYKPEIM